TTIFGEHGPSSPRQPSALISRWNESRSTSRRCRRSRTSAPAARSVVRAVRSACTFVIFAIVAVRDALASMRPARPGAGGLPVPTCSRLARPYLILAEGRDSAIVRVLSCRRRHCRVDGDLRARQNPRLLARREPRREDAVIDLARDGEAAELRRGNEQP